MPKLGYLLPTRERVMEGHHETGSLLALAETAEGLGYDSIWVGDSVTARPRHDPLTLLAAVAARTRKAELGTAVLLPALRNPVLLAHQVATVDRIAEGRLILGIGIAADMPAIRRRVRGDGRAVRQARRPHERGDAALQGAVERQAGRLGQALDREAGHGRPDAASPGRPADLVRRRPAGRPRAHRQAL